MLKLVKLALLVTLVIAATSIPAMLAASVPKFADYPARQVFTGKPAKPRIVTADQRYWAEQIVSGKPNFAGHYRVVDWPCGTECMGLAIIDVTNGAVHAPPLSSDAWPFSVPIASTDFQYPEYRLDSALFILRNACPEGLEKCSTYYFKWENDAFTVVTRIPLKTLKHQAKRPSVGKAPVMVK